MSEVGYIGIVGGIAEQNQRTDHDNTAMALVAGADAVTLGQHRGPDPKHGHRLTAVSFLLCHTIYQGQHGDMAFDWRSEPPERKIGLISGRHLEHPDLMIDLKVLRPDRHRETPPGCCSRCRSWP